MKHNALLQARYKFSMMEKRILYQLINSENNPKVSDLTCYRYTIEEVYVALKNLRNKSILISNDEGIWESGYLTSYSHTYSTDHICVVVSPIFLHCLEELTPLYTPYQIAQMITFSSTYSIRMYDYLSEQKRTFRVKVTDLRNILCVQNSYSRYALFHQYAFSVAQKELKRVFEEGHGNLYFTYSEVRKKRSVSHLDIRLMSSEPGNGEPLGYSLLDEEVFKYRD